MELEQYFEIVYKILTIPMTLEGFTFSILGLISYVFLIGLACLIFIGGLK